MRRRLLQSHRRRSDSQSILREAIITEMASRAGPLKAVLLDLGATTGQDTPSIDFLAELGEGLDNLTVRFMLAGVIAPVWQVLDHAGPMEKVRLQDVLIASAAAVLVDLLSPTFGRRIKRSEMEKDDD